MNIEIQPVIPDHAERLLVLGAQMIDGADFGELDRRKALMFAYPKGDQFYRRSVFVDGELVGFFFGHVSENIFSRQKSAHDSAIYLSPNARRSGVFRAMVDNFEAWAKAQGAEYVWIAQSLGSKENNILPALEDMGFDYLGPVTRKKL